MKELNSLEPYKWIENETAQVEGISPNWNGNFVSHCVPKRYEAYCKILYPIYADANIKDKSIMRDDNDEEDDFVYGQRIFYKDLAKELGLQYTKGIDIGTFWRAWGEHYPRYLSYVEEGHIDETSCPKIIELLKPFTANQECYFYYYFLATKDWKSDKLFKGNLDEVLSFYSHPNLRFSPTYWWVEDKSWCLCTDHDLDFTLIGGNRELINKFLQDDFLECIEVDLTTRVDYKADENNKPSK